MIEKESINKFIDVAKKYSPLMLNGLCTATCMIGPITSASRLRMLATCYGVTSMQYIDYKNKVERMGHSNNWLKMHHKSLRRGKENKTYKEWWLD